MNYWLMKSEPDVYGIEHLAKAPKQSDRWDGIRNYQVRNMIRDEIKKGDLAFFYHSRCKQPGIVGIVEIIKEAYPDTLAFDPKSKYYDVKSDPENPRWLMFDVQLKEIFSRTVTLTELKAQKQLKNMRVVAKGNRLSIMPVSKAEWDFIVAMI